MTNYSLRKGGKLVFKMIFQSAALPEQRQQVVHVIFFGNRKRRLIADLRPQVSYRKVIIRLAVVGHRIEIIPYLHMPVSNALHVALLLGLLHILRNQIIHISFVRKGGDFPAISLPLHFHSFALPGGIRNRSDIAARGFEI